MAAVVTGAEATAPAAEPAAETRAMGYRIYALAVLLAANVLNYADRTLLSALAQPIKQQLQVTDAELGFLAGTSFVLFNAIVGIAMARVGDRWRRNRLLVFGIALWSAMTMASGLAANYPQLVAARIGVGIGEATIGAVGYSMLADIFPQRQRAMVFSIFICGPFLGLTISLAAGSWVAASWPQACGGFGLCGLAGWQAAFFAFGAPGLLAAALVGFVGEPMESRRRSEPGRPSPLAEGLAELSLILPPFALVQAWRIGGRRAAVGNLAAAALIVLAAWGLVRLTGSLAQWAAVAVAAYGLYSWAQAQKLRDPQMHRLTIGSPAFLAAVLGAAFIASIHGAAQFWSVPLAMRRFGLGLAEAGGLLGAAIGGGSLCGTLIGGVVADRWRRATKAAPIYQAAVCVGLGAVLLAGMLLASSPRAMLLAVTPLMVCLAAWPAAITALTQDLVTPEVRARTAALYVTITNLIGGSIGPYAVGRIGDATGSLRTGLSVLFVLPPLALILLFVAARALPAAYARRDQPI
jgi:MFS family permease